MNNDKNGIETTFEIKRVYDSESRSSKKRPQNNNEWQLKCVSDFPITPGELFAWHIRPGAFERLIPPWQKMEVLSRKGQIAKNGTIVMRVYKGPFFIDWHARHHGYVEGKKFIDVQDSGPFKRWVHTHRFETLSDVNHARLIDDVRLAYPPMAAFLSSLHQGFRGFIERDLRRLFLYRHETMKMDFQAHRNIQQIYATPLKVVIAGASGLVGSALTHFFTSGGHTVVPLSRERPEQWNPQQGFMDISLLKDADCVINLAGENIAGSRLSEIRWSKNRKDRILQSRVLSTRLISESLAKLKLAGELKNPSLTFINASAVGYYGDTGYDAAAESVSTEQSRLGVGFLPDVANAWEAATLPAKEAGLRVVLLRLGIVLTPAGGALQKMLPVFRAGLGGPLGTGHQWMSWIAMQDVLGIIAWVIAHPHIVGPINAVSPEAVTNQTFSKTLGEVLRRPVWARVPQWLIRTALGEMGEATL